jgi:SUZ domain
MSLIQDMSSYSDLNSQECICRDKCGSNISPETRLSELSRTLLRTPGSSASSTVASEDGLPPTTTPEFKQIMKRIPGKSARDAEDDAKSESSQSQVLTHEERQAMYEKTRARIFSDYVESQIVEPVEKESDTGSESKNLPRIMLIMIF